MKRREYYEFTTTEDPTALSFVPVDSVHVLTKSDKTLARPHITIAREASEIPKGVSVRVVELTADEVLQLTKIPPTIEYKKEDL